LQDKQPLEVIAADLHRSEDTIGQKCRRLSLKVVVNRPRKTVTTTSEVVIPKDLSSIQEALQILAAALKTAVKQVLNQHVGLI